MLSIVRIRLGLIRLEVSSADGVPKIYYFPGFVVILNGRKQPLCQGLERLFEERLDLRVR